MDDLASPSSDVRVSPALESERSLIEGLLQFYLYDLSEMEPVGSDALDFDESGGYEPHHLPADCWAGANRHSLLIRLGEKIAGFALLNTQSHRGVRVDRNMAEFFVARKFRRRGVAS